MESMRLVILAITAILLFAAFGCVGAPASTPPQQTQKQATPQTGSVQGQTQSGQPQTNPAAGKEAQTQAGQTPEQTQAPTQAGQAAAQGAGGQAQGSGQTPAQNPSAPAENTGAGAGGQEGPVLAEWKAPDGSITLQVPTGWKASEKQVDNCTVNWEALDPAGTRSAYMNNQIMVLKSEDVRKMYKAYGLTGIDQVPVSGYLGAEEATQQIIAPLTGASGVRMTYQDAEMSKQFSQAVCMSGLVACDAQVFEAAYQRNGNLMRGQYMVQTYDLGDGGTWWINIWGYTSPASDWNNSASLLEKVFSSVKYTDAWAARCRAAPADASGIINEVVKSRQAASEKAAQGWDQYNRGE